MISIIQVVLGGKDTKNIQIFLAISKKNAYLCSKITI